MNYYLDTDICIFALKNTFPSIKTKLQSILPERIKIPSIVRAELLLGTLKSNRPKEVHSIVEQFLEPFEIIPFCSKCSEIYASIRWDLESKGMSIGPNDLLIASTVLANQGTLVTHNTKEYNRISGLKIQDWTEST